MASSCHSAPTIKRPDNAPTIALAGNPNVGKSSIFNHLTNSDAETANYPGKTVALNLGITRVNGKEIALIDLPGTYALGALSEDQWVARRAVLDNRPDSILAVVDATNLARNLYLVLQLLDLEIPMVVALNLVDEAERMGKISSPKRLSERLNVPVVPTVATRGEGLNEAMQRALVAANSNSAFQSTPNYGEPVERIIGKLAAVITLESSDQLPYGLSPRALSLLILEEDQETLADVRSEAWGDKVLVEASRTVIALTEMTGEPPSLNLPRKRHELAAEIASFSHQSPRSYKPDSLINFTTSPITGIPLLGVVLASVFAFLFFAGNLMATAFGELWGSFVSPVLTEAINWMVGDGALARILLWGFDAGIQAALAVGIPYVLTFYFLLAILEDTGYLNSVSFLGDQLMRKFGLHGRAIIPLVAGAGCNVPAVIGTRVLGSMRERVIASTLIVLVPCSARTAVILGAVSLYVGWKESVALFGIIFLVITLVGVGLNFAMPGKPGDLVVEMFPYRWPHLKTTLKKTWHRFKEFIFVAAPIVFVGSVVLGALYETNLIWSLSAPLSPVVEGWLGLPAVAGLTLIFAVLRKELALQLLVALAIAVYGTGADNLLTFMGPRQLMVYALVNTLYIPCASTIAVLGSELGWRRGSGIIALSIAIALLLGGLLNRGLLLAGWA